MSNEMKVCSDLDLLHPYAKQCALKVLKRCEEEGLNVGVFETLRSLARRKYLVSIGNSKTINSYHGLGLAVDFVFKTPKGNWTWNRPKEDWDKLAAILYECGFTPGWWWKSFKDGPHGQIDFVGIRSTTLYAKLAQKEEDLPWFYEYVDELLLKDKCHSGHYKKLLNEALKVKVGTAKVTMEVPEGNKIILENVPVKEKPSPIPAPSEGELVKAGNDSDKPNILMIILQFIISLFGGKNER